MENTNNYNVSRYNATKHGLRSQDAVLPWESAASFEELQNSLFEEYAPTTATQRELVEQLTQIFWRQRRMFFAENSMMKIEAENNFSIPSFNGYDAVELTPNQQVICNSMAGKIDNTDKLIRNDAHLSRRLARTLGLLHQLKMVENNSNTINC